MLLAVDTGNSSTDIGLFDDKGLLRHFSLPSTEETYRDGLYRAMAGLLSEAGADGAEGAEGAERTGGAVTDGAEAAVVCSVVPALDGLMREALGRLLKGAGVFFLGEELQPTMPIITERPREVGADRLANAAGAHAMYRDGVIVVDMGTAITVDVVTKRGEFAGGAIAPGPGVSMDALAERTALLPRAAIRRPERAVGRNTTEALESGLYHGFTGLVDNMIRAIMDELHWRPPVVATGGFSVALAGGCRFITKRDEFLTLKGLKTIYEGIRCGD